MDRKALIRLLENYSSPFQEEQHFKSQFLELLKAANAFQRTHLPGHITGSAWVVNSDATKTLLVHHAKLNKWVQPGGHADGDENVVAVAQREAEEETGLMNFKLEESIFDLDIHTIPAREDFPEHQHYDIRFLLRADEKERVVVSEESHDVKWIRIDQLRNYTTERSVLRMSEKLTQKSH
jgi:8-oxo-dGTP pyrophosphatase MutT (NUDIX family)